MYLYISHNAILLMMKVSIIAWENDSAGMNIINSLKSMVDFDEERLNVRVGNTEVKLRLSSDSIDVYIVSRDTVFLENIDDLVANYRAAIFASRHESKSRKPIISIHVPGNLYNEAKLGGKPWSLCLAHGAFMMNIFKHMYTLFQNSNIRSEGWGCCYEATHHGPYIENVPTLYIEIGSSEAEWKNKEVAEILARALIEGIQEPVKNESMVGISGLHYAIVLSRRCAERDLPLGHVIPRYVLEKVDESKLRKLIDNVITRSIGFQGFVMERKALKSKDKKILLNLW